MTLHQMISVLAMATFACTGLPLPADSGTSGGKTEQDAGQDAGHAEQDAGRVAPPGADTCVDAPLLRVGDRVVNDRVGGVFQWFCFCPANCTARYYRLVIPARSAAIARIEVSGPTLLRLHVIESCEVERAANVVRQDCPQLQLPRSTWGAADVLVENPADVERDFVLIMDGDPTSPYSIALIGVDARPELSCPSSGLPAPLLPAGSLADTRGPDGQLCAGAGTLYELELPARSYAVLYGLRQRFVVNEQDVFVRRTVGVDLPIAWLASPLEPNTSCARAIDLIGTQTSGALTEALPRATTAPCGTNDTTLYWLFWNVTLPPRSRNVLRGEVPADDGTGIDFRVLSSCASTTCEVQSSGGLSTTASTTLDNPADTPRRVIVAVGQKGVGIAGSRAALSVLSSPR